MKLKLFSSLSSIVLISGAGTLSAAVVAVPNANANSVGGEGITPAPIPSNYGTTGQRFQKVYDSSQLGGFASSEMITKLAFRARPSQFAFAIDNSVTVSNVIITLSTTSKTADFSSANYISNQFPNNIGADVTTVYSGPITFTTAGVVGTTSFDYVVNLQSLFTFQKGLGNLLLDVTVPDGATTSGPGSIGYAPFDFASDDLVTSDGVASAFGTGSTTAIGANSTAGVTQFTTSPVPEPASIGAIVCGGALLLRRRRIA